MTDKEQKFVETYLSTKTITECCKKLGIARKTAYNYLENPEVKASIRERKLQVMRETSLYMEDNLKKATESLVDIIEDFHAPSSVKVQAINSLFSNYQKLNETIDIETELDAIQTQLQDIASHK